MISARVILFDSQLEALFLGGSGNSRRWDLAEGCRSLEAGLHGILHLVLSSLPQLCPVHSSSPTGLHSHCVLLKLRDRQACTKLSETLNYNEDLLPEAALSGLCNRKKKKTYHWILSGTSGQ